MNAQFDRGARSPQVQCAPASLAWSEEFAGVGKGLGCGERVSALLSDRVPVLLGAASALQ